MRSITNELAHGTTDIYGIYDISDSVTYAINAACAMCQKQKTN